MRGKSEHTLQAWKGIALLEAWKDVTEVEQGRRDL